MFLDHLLLELLVAVVEGLDLRVELGDDATAGVGLFFGVREERDGGARG